MRVLLDENIPGDTEEWLRRQEHEVRRLPRRTSDREIARFADQHDAILLTRDRDFLHFLPSTRSGIIVVRIHPPIAQVITRAVNDLLAANPEPWLRGKTLILHRDGYEVVR